jgi:hypothetical protein
LAATYPGKVIALIVLVRNEVDQGTNQILLSDYEFRPFSILNLLDLIQKWKPDFHKCIGRNGWDTLLDRRYWTCSHSERTVLGILNRRKRNDQYMDRVTIHSATPRDSVNFQDIHMALINLRFRARSSRKKIDRDHINSFGFCMDHWVSLETHSKILLSPFTRLCRAFFPWAIKIPRRAIFLRLTPIPNRIYLHIPSIYLSHLNIFSPLCSVTSVWDISL